ncbi:MAG: flagellar M-ring protein FliF [Clostridia bacterium]|nr:flagellar M-ring protein FliF [Clostridia bacterium]
MTDQLKKAWEAVKQFWTNASKKIKIIIIAVAVLVIVGALVASIMLNKKDYVIIYEDVSDAESSEIFKALAETEYDVKQDSSGNILCLAEQESAVRMQLATAGYPKTGLSYYVIEDNSSMLSTDYERKQYRNMQLQERIAASIQTLEGVKQAVVTITPEEEDVFYLKKKAEPSASVIVHMKDGYKLTETQVDGILKLVSKAVSGLKEENIALTDGQGNELKQDSQTAIETTKARLTTDLEEQLRKKIIQVLTGPYDSSQFKVSVTVTLNTDALVRETITYNPSPDGNNSGVINKESHTTENSTSTERDGGVVGTTTNSDVATYPIGTATGESSMAATSDDYEYLVSSVKEQMEKGGAAVEDVSIGVAIDKGNFDPGERENVAQLVAYAAGVELEDVTVQNFRFYKEAEEPQPEPETHTVLYIVLGSILLLILIALTVILLLRRRKKKKEAEELAALEARLAEDAGSGEEGEPISPIEKLQPVMDARRQEVKEFATNNPEIAAAMIKTWLKNEND